MITLKRLNIFNIPEEVTNKAREECEKLNYKLISIFRKSNDENESYRYVVLAENKKPSLEDRPCCVWTFFSTDNKLHDGCYDLSDGKALSVCLHRICNESIFPDY